MEGLKEKLAEALRELLECDGEIDEDMGFYDMGLSSLTVFTFAERISELFNVKCDDADIFNYPNINELSEYIESQLDE